MTELTAVRSWLSTKAGNNPKTTVSICLGLGILLTLFVEHVIL